jgi:hypothetical protein
MCGVKISRMKPSIKRLSLSNGLQKGKEPVKEADGKYFRPKGQLSVQGSG